VHAGGRTSCQIGSKNGVENGRGGPFSELPARWILHFAPPVVASQLTARSPTGMHGVNMASRFAERLPLGFSPPFFKGEVSTPQSSPAHAPGRSRLLETAFPSPTAGIPLQALPRLGHRSRPISSLSRRSRSRPVRSRTPLLSGNESGGEAHRPFSVICAETRVPNSSSNFRSPLGFFVPSGSQRSA
jgi:hypothetical protein